MGGFTATDIANQALDAIGCQRTLGDMQDGSHEAQIILRAYAQCFRQLSRAAHWNTLRKQAPLTLLADATGNTPNVGTAVPTPFVYEYAYPTDCLKARFVPWNFLSANTTIPGNISIPATPISTAQGQPPPYPYRVIPARFLESFDPNYPTTPQPSASYELGTPVNIVGASQSNPCQIMAPGNNLQNGNLAFFANVGGMVQLNGNTYQVANVNAGAGTFTLEDAGGNAINSAGFGPYTGGGTLAQVTPVIPNPALQGQGTQFWEVQGASPIGRTVILTNVKFAVLVYTAFIPYPSMWDALFRAAFVAYLASEVALPIWVAKDKEFGLKVRQLQMGVAAEKVKQARATDGQEGWFNSDIEVDWMRGRVTGGWGGGNWGFGGGFGDMGAISGYDTSVFSSGNTSAY